MPIYEYMCDKCSVITTDFQNSSKCSKTVKCFKCGLPAKKIISAPSSFKIKGFSEKNGYSKGDK